MKLHAILAAAAVMLAACSQMTPSPKPLALKDGEVAVPVNYKSWPKMLSEVQRPDAKQMREMYIDPQGAKTKAGDPFPNGTVMVMENYAAKAKPDGSMETGPDGKLVKGNMVRIFVMGKGDGWGQDVPEALRNGNWVYASFAPDGSKTDDNLMACRGCHLTITDKKDFVHRYDEYFQKRAAY